MAAVPPSSERRRPRPGSLERPVNGRLYRGTWLLVGLPLLLLAFSVARPAPLQPPNLPPAFDRDAAAQLARDLSTQWPNRVPGTAGATGAAEWFREQLAPYGFIVRSEPFTATIPGRGKVRFTNLVAVKPGASRRTIVVMAHRDNSGVGPGANDNASGTAALIELARAYAPQAGAARLQLPYSLVFLSTDGGTDGGIGAAQFAAHSLEAPNVAAVLNLDAVAGRGGPRLEFAGDTPRSPEPGLVETARSVLTQETGAQPGWPGALRQLIDLGFPFSLYEQAPFVSRGVPAVTITTSPDRPPSGAGDTVGSLNVRRLEQVGRAVQNALDAMEQGVALSSGPSSYVYLGQRIVRGWAIEIVLIAMLLPFLAAAIDLFARCRRRRIRVAPAFRSYRSRLLFWIWCGLLVALFGLFGAWTSGTGRPPPLDERQLADRRADRAGRAHGHQLVRRPRAAAPAPPRPAGGGARRSRRGAARARRRRPARGRDESVRAAVPAAVAARVALAAAGARASAAGTARRPADRLRRTGSADLVVRRTGTASASTLPGTSPRCSASAMRRSFCS